MDEQEPQARCPDGQPCRRECECGHPCDRDESGQHICDRLGPLAGVDLRTDYDGTNPPPQLTAEAVTRAMTKFRGPFDA